MTTKQAYRNEERRKAFKAGFRAAMLGAAEFVNSWDGGRSKYRMGDLLLSKFNMRKAKPRRSKNRTKA